MDNDLQLWIVMIALGIGIFGLRFAFTGLVGDRQMPEWLLRHLRYTAVAVLPALVAPLVAWPAATNGEVDPARLLAAFAALIVGFVSKRAMAAILAGIAVLYVMLWWLG